MLLEVFYAKPVLGQVCHLHDEPQPPNEINLGNFLFVFHFHAAFLSPPFLTHQLIFCTPYSGISDQPSKYQGCMHGALE